MPRFLTVHSQAFTIEQLTKLTQAADQLPAGVSWSSTDCAIGSERSFCEWKAPSREPVEQVLKANNLPFIAIYQVRRFNPAQAGFEAD